MRPTPRPVVEHLDLRNAIHVGHSTGGGEVARYVAKVRKMILAGTSAAGGEGVSNVGAVLQNAVAKATADKKHPKQSLFFTQSHDGQKAAAEFLQRLGTRQQDRDLPATQETIVAQVTAITKWGHGA
jgi:pimeloyl-ACP methyl ester carboxylesterase